MGTGFDWEKSEKLLYSKGLPVLFLTNIFRDLVWKRHLTRINCLILLDTVFCQKVKTSFGIADTIGRLIDLVKK